MRVRGGRERLAGRWPQPLGTGPVALAPEAADHALVLPATGVEAVAAILPPLHLKLLIDRVLLGHPPAGQRAPLQRLEHGAPVERRML